MKKLLFIFISLIVLSSCITGPKEDDKSTKAANTTNTEADVTISENSNSFGEVVILDKAADARRLPIFMESVNEKEVKLIGVVKEVCQMSGCWLDMDIGNDQVVHVTFKNEAFVVPKDLAGTAILVKGIATKEVLPVEMLKKMALDEGKTQKEIDAIKSPETEYYLEAVGLNLR